MIFPYMHPLWLPTGVTRKNEYRHNTKKGPGRQVSKQTHRPRQSRKSISRQMGGNR